MRFTPAPWRVQRIYEQLAYIILAKGDGIEREIAQVHVSEANANLIAAAPEMYNFLSTLPWGQLTPEQLERLGPILGKARGFVVEEEKCGQ
jgi:hypothetical protein